jgi:hypothetical protein
MVHRKEDLAKYVTAAFVAWLIPWQSIGQGEALPGPGMSLVCSSWWCLGIYAAISSVRYSWAAWWR